MHIGMASMLYKIGLSKTDRWNEFLITDDPLRRIGVSVSFKYNFIKGLRMSYGPWFNHQSG